MNGLVDSNWTATPIWAAVIIAGYPLLTIVLSEMSRRTVRESGSEISRFLRLLQYTVLPAVVIWILLHKLISIAPDSLMVRIADTIAGILVLYAVLLFAQTVLVALQSRTDGSRRAPKLFYELASLVIAVVGGAIIISTVWGIKLTTLFGALGVGSVVLGLALQSVIGGLASGLIVLSGRHFSIGDWLEVNGVFARIVQVDWRSVTLDSGGIRLVVPSSQLSTSTLRIRHGQQPVAVKVSMVFPAIYSPDEVKAGLLEAAAGVEQALAGSAASAMEEYGAGGPQYFVTIAVDDPAKVASARSTLLDRIWYVRSRRGLDSTPDQDTDPEAIEKRVQLLTEYGSMRGPQTALTEMAAASRVENYGPGEYLLRRNTPARTIYVLVTGNLSLSINTRNGPVIVERIASGQMFVIREIFRNGRSPVDLVADCESKVIAVPAAAIHKVLDQDRKLATDLEHMIESRNELIKTIASADC